MALMTEKCCFIVLALTVALAGSACASSCKFDFIDLEPERDGNSRRRQLDGTNLLHLSHVHRGGGKLERPDNTLETFRWCWENGSALECDCRRTRDGVGIMLHDKTLARTARGISPELALLSAAGVETGFYVLEPGGRIFHGDYSYVQEVADKLDEFAASSFV